MKTTLMIFGLLGLLVGCGVGQSSKSASAIQDDNLTQILRFSWTGFPTSSANKDYFADRYNTCQIYADDHNGTMEVSLTSQTGGRQIQVPLSSLRQGSSTIEGTMYSTLTYEETDGLKVTKRLTIALGEKKKNMKMPIFWMFEAPGWFSTKTTFCRGLRAQQ